MAGILEDTSLDEAYALERYKKTLSDPYYQEMLSSGV